MLIIYVRHGEPIYNPDQLTPLGERQAESVARRLALFGVDEVYASTSKRAMQTAQPTCELLGKKLQTLDFLNENYLHELKIPVEGADPDWVWAHHKYAPILTSREVRELGEKWYEHPDLAPFGIEKRLAPITEQMDAFIASYGYEHDIDKGLYKVVNRQPEKRIAIFAHECMGKIVMSHLLDIPFPQYATHVEMSPSAFTVLRMDDGSLSARSKTVYPYARARLLTVSNDSHLYRDGLPLVHRYTHLRDRF